MKKAICLVFILSLGAGADEPYRKPPAAIQQILDAPITPTFWLNPSRDTALMGRYEAYPPLSALAQPMLKLAGVRLNPRTFGRHETSWAQGLTLKRLKDGRQTDLKLPKGARVSQVTWSANGKRFAFCNTTDDAIQLWVGEVASGQLRQIPGVRLNAVFHGLEWLPDQQFLLVCTVPKNPGPAPALPAVPAGPNVQESSGKGPSSTYEVRDVLKSPHDASLFDYYATSQMAVVDLRSNRVQPVGKPALYTSVDASPDGRHILTESIHRPYSYMHSYGRFPSEVEVWNRQGQLEKKVASLPLFDQVPLEGVPTGPRNVRWEQSQPATLVWEEALDDGDSQKKVSHHDKLMEWSAPFGAAPQEFARTEWRSQGLAPLANGDRLLYEYDWEKRQRRIWLWSRTGAPKLLWDLNVAERYKNPGSPVYRRLPDGRQVVHQDGDWIYLSGQGATPQGDRPFLDRFNLATLATQRLFQSDEAGLESFVAWVDSSKGRFITRAESPTEPPNFYLRQAGQRQALTQFPDYTPQLRGVTKRLIRYQRADGTPLSMTLYLPPGYQQGTRLPTILWAYPLEYSTAALAGQVSGSEKSFVRIWGDSPVFFALHGYAVLDNVAMPVVGAPETVYDSFIEQTVANSKAALDKAAELGVTDPKRVGVAGHSHGALMTANLLAHSDLFRAGCARSGAHNHTLRPFGFQSEKRTFYQAPETYVKLSPTLNANKINEPLLIIHGEWDSNPGTVPLQSQKLYEAVAGTGGTTRLVMLPLEDHGYQSKESIQHCLYEMLSWFDKYVKNAP
jgi:dipeptidyl aminopeptidase/acylaminoacyl peptidase